MSNTMSDAFSSHADTELADINPNGALDLAIQKAQHFTDAARSDGTQRVYTEAFAKWTEWAHLHHVTANAPPPEAIAAYLAALAREGKSLSSINVALSAIQRTCRAHGCILDRKNPTIADTLRGIARRAAKAVDRAEALDLPTLKRLVTAIDGNDLRSLRDKALILLGFFGALRRSEIVSLELDGRSTFTITDRGVLLKLSATKASLKTEDVAIPRRNDELCPVAALESYLAISGITSGPVFRAVSKSGQILDRGLDATSVRHILAQRLLSAGVEPSKFSPHSLRAGFITAAERAKVPEHLIQRTSRHKSVDVLRSYIRVADAFEENAAKFI
ncbi:site-specific integrase [Hyphomicrobium sp.]|uniref:site-specific integrase n=1 Tax=Hyphomicrobium sp. TaxID=82 RepID=UPI0025B80025|nr:site-specific integrase [Hyphomicrobium sp.]